MIFTFFATHAVEPNARRALQRVLQTVAGRVFAQGGDTVRLDSSSVAQVLEGPDGVRRLVVSTRGQRGSDAILVGSPKQLELDPAGATVMVDLVEATAIEVDPEGAYHCTTADTLHAVFPVRLGGSAGVTALSDEALLRRVATRRQKGLRYGRDRLELEKRFSFPVACLAFSLLGFPLGYIRTRGNKAYGYLVSAAVILVYYLVVRAADTWADPHPVAARLLLWAPNGVAILVGVVWIRLKERGRR